ncbi:MAG: S9 family peptidase [Actinomycetia bacterium]|nr:S9 family peptidase [Actinomycetes bacterium]
MEAIVQYGSWSSTLSAQAVAAAGTRLGSARRRPDGTVLWWEGRPRERGRGVIVSMPSGGERTDVTPVDSNVRSRVHEYDGGSWTVFDDGTVAYVENIDQNIRLVAPDSSIRDLTVGDDSTRFGDLTPHGSYLLAVREVHGNDHVEPVNDIVAIDIASGEVSVVASGSDFYSSPRPSPDAGQIAYICWEHPDMPWDTTELRLVRWDDGAVGPDTSLLAGWSTQQPTWVGDDLVVITDPTGWWIPHRVDGPGCTTPLVDHNIEFGVPPWVFGSHTLVPMGDCLLAVAHVEGRERLVRIDDGQVEDLGCSRVAFDSISAAGDNRVIVAASSPTRPPEVVVLGPGGFEEIVVGVEAPLSGDDVSIAEHISFPSGERTAHALFYRPASSTVSAPDGDVPPLVVLGHGGPTGAASAGFAVAIQFWTQRGFAVVDVNYGGSTGYGTAYRHLLDGRWGIVDVEDCIAAAQHLAQSGLIDASRMAIKGGSAGGYTTLCALTFHDTFAAGVSRYGIGDLEALARDTHKFESRYLDRMIGPYPERRDLYRERSPINFTELLDTPMLVLQGSIDPIVPPNQAEAMVAALAERQVPYAYLLFEGESHGFRQGENITRAIEAEYVFLCRVFGVEPSGQPEALEIHNL